MTYLYYVDETTQQDLESLNLCLNKAIIIIIIIMGINSAPLYS